MAIVEAKQAEPIERNGCVPESREYRPAIYNGVESARQNCEELIREAKRVRNLPSDNPLKGLQSLLSSQKKYSKFLKWFRQT